MSFLCPFGVPDSPCSLFGMSLTFTNDDFARFEAATRVLLSPLAAPSFDAWRREVTKTVRDLLNADQTIFMAPYGQDIFFSEDAPEVSKAMAELTEEYSSEGIRLKDPVVNLWQALRRQGSVEVISWDINAQMIGAHGYTMADSFYVNEVLIENGAHDFWGLYSAIPAGEVLIWALFKDKATARFGEETSSLLRALLPSLKAGLDAFTRYRAHSQTLDALAEPLLVFDADGGEIHRNCAFTCLINPDPERDRLLMELRVFVHRLRRLTFPQAGRADEAALAPARHTVTTRMAHYELRATFLPTSPFNSEGSILVEVSTDSGPALPPVETLRERFGLTLREGEVALLLAEGIPNDRLAERLFISPHTARRHTERVLEKLGLRSRKALALKLMQHDSGGV